MGRRRSPCRRALDLLVDCLILAGLFLLVVFLLWR